jgi:hypothetical protein
MTHLLDVRRLERAMLVYFLRRTASAELTAEVEGAEGLGLMPGRREEILVAFPVGVHYLYLSVADGL